jgi:hypothetical protein
VHLGQSLGQQPLTCSGAVEAAGALPTYLHSRLKRFLLTHSKLMVIASPGGLVGEYLPLTPIPKHYQHIANTLPKHYQDCAKTSATHRQHITKSSPTHHQIVFKALPKHSQHIAKT